MSTRIFVMLAAAASLSACAMSDGTRPDTDQGNMQNDMKPSAQVKAFQRMDARLGYDNARIQYDNDNCLLYQGVDQGETKVMPLTDESGEQICVR